jgi:prolyl 4-hydroxylase
MSIMDEVHAAARAGRPEDGVAMLERAALHDAEAMFVLANWRLWGLYGPRDLAETHRLLRHSGELGWQEAIELRATLLGNGTGVERDLDAACTLLQPLAATRPDMAAMIALLDRMAPSATAAGFPREQISSNPLVTRVPDFLAPEECAWLIDRATPALAPSMIIDERTGGPRPHPVRTSHSMNFDPSSEDLVTHQINRRIAALTDTDVSQGEPLHILRYAPGQEFRLHHDAIPGAANQRRWTLLVWLNDGYAGGETSFADAALTITGAKGDALLFCNTDDDGGPDPLARHAGMAVTSGTKWLASRWIRERPYEAEVIGR